MAAYFDTMKGIKINRLLPVKYEIWQLASTGSTSSGKKI